jgi:uracil-DNA glycosylase
LSARPANLLDQALAEAGIDRADVYVTNAVKHFKFEERGKRRKNGAVSSNIHRREP